MSNDRGNGVTTCTPAWAHQQNNYNFERALKPCLLVGRQDQHFFVWPFLLATSIEVRSFRRTPFLIPFGTSLHPPDAAACTLPSQSIVPLDSCELIRKKWQAFGSHTLPVLLCCLSGVQLSDHASLFFTRTMEIRRLLFAHSYSQATPECDFLGGMCRNSKISRFKLSSAELLSTDPCCTSLASSLTNVHHNKNCVVKGTAIHLDGGSRMPSTQAQFGTSVAESRAA